MTGTTDKGGGVIRPIFGSDLKAKILAFHARFSIAHPDKYPIGLKEFREEYLEGAQMNPAIRPQFIRRFRQAVLALEKLGEMQTNRKPDPEHPNRIPQKFIDVWKKERPEPRD